MVEFWLGGVWWGGQGQVGRGGDECVFDVQFENEGFRVLVEYSQVIEGMVCLFFDFF